MNSVLACFYKLKAIQNILKNCKPPKEGHETENVLHKNFSDLYQNLFNIVGREIKQAG